MARLSGAFGNLIRGILASLVGVDLLVGATSDDPSKVKSLDQVLVTTEHLDLGPPALGGGSRTVVIRRPLAVRGAVSPCVRSDG